MSFNKLLDNFGPNVLSIVHSSVVFILGSAATLIANVGQDSGWLGLGSTFGILSILAWYLYYNESHARPEKDKMHQAVVDKINDRHSVEMEKQAAIHREQLKEIMGNYNKSLNDILTNKYPRSKNPSQN